MASTTKIMTTLLCLESGDLDTEFTVDPEAIKTEGSSMGLTEGDIVSKRDLCIGMLLPSEMTQQMQLQYVSEAV